MKKNQGITLVALVITIIVLLILSGVTITFMLGDNGIIGKAKLAKEEIRGATVEEEANLWKADIEMTKHTQETAKTLEEILQKLKNQNLLTDNEIEEIMKEENINREIKIGSKTISFKIDVVVPEGPIFTTVANAPDISGFNRENTYYVSWDLTNSPYQINENTNLNGRAPSNWYDYTEGTNHWANVKTIGGGNDCYWVWIPRYAYCITEGYHTNTASTIDIKFLQGTTNIPIDGSTIEIKNQIGSGNWNVHPAFWFDKNNNGVEDNGEQLTGIWVAKFEASSNSSTVVENPTAKQLAIDGGSNTDIDLKVRVKPNVTSWRGITVNNIFTVCQNLTLVGNSLENTSNIDSHMMKNTEWGAVAYLSMSIYGKNGEVWNNPYYNNTTNFSPITGLCGNESNGKDNATTDINKTWRYNEVGGGNASTTGNVYGVYDMVGGAWEYVSGVYKGGASSNDGSKLWDFNNLKYVDQYTETIGSQATYFGNINKYGDAIYETSNSGNSSTGSWEATNSKYPDSSYPIFVRGGRAMHASNGGVFSFYNGDGTVSTSGSFRPVVLSSQP